MEGPRVGLRGYCPVCILDANKWVKGSPEHQATYDGVTYSFPDEAIKQKFLADPAKYVPALGGDCIVCYAKLGNASRAMSTTLRGMRTGYSCSRRRATAGVPQQPAGVRQRGPRAEGRLCGLPGPPQQARCRQARVRGDQGRIPLSVPVRTRAGRLPQGSRRVPRPASEAGCHGVEDEPTSCGDRLADRHGEDDVRRLRSRCQDHREP